LLILLSGPSVPWTLRWVLLLLLRVAAGPSIPSSATTRFHLWRTQTKIITSTCFQFEYCTAILLTAIGRIQFEFSSAHDYNRFNKRGGNVTIPRDEHERYLRNFSKMRFDSSVHFHWSKMIFDGATGAININGDLASSELTRSRLRLEVSPGGRFKPIDNWCRSGGTCQPSDLITKINKLHLSFVCFSQVNTNSGCQCKTLYS
jgi:hypothetical protein